MEIGTRRGYHGLRPDETSDSSPGSVSMSLNAPSAAWRSETSLSKRMFAASALGARYFLQRFTLLLKPIVSGYASASARTMRQGLNFTSNLAATCSTWACRGDTVGAATASLRLLKGLQTDDASHI